MTTGATNDPRLFSPSHDRNHEPIRAALRPWLAPRQGTVLEIGSGSGQHILGWAAAFPGLIWQPSDLDPGNLASIRAWSEDGPDTLRPPVLLDAAQAWSLDADPPLTAVISLNVIHISPWQVAEGIVASAASHLGAGGLLMFYGPFRENGVHTGEGNARFDASLRAQNPDWGIRDLNTLAAAATDHGFAPPVVEAMPSNNRLVTFRRSGA